MMGVTIRHVAVEAGVSTATVSRVLNNSGHVLDETRRRVEEAAQRLQYTPNSSARSLITNRTHAFGVLLPELHGDFFSEVIRGVEQTAQQNSYHVLLSSMHSNRSEIEASLKMMRGRVDGLIIMSPHIDAETLRANLPDSLPVVLVNCYVNGTRFDSVNIDNFGGAYRLTANFASHGHRRIAIITGSRANIDAAERLRGFYAALEDAGIGSSDYIEAEGDFTEGSGYRAAKQLIDIDPRPTAVFASNDSMAIGALRAFHEAGLAVPEDIALAGFDDIPINEYISPSLTSVHVPIAELGTIAIETLVQAIESKNRHERKQTVLPVRLVIRESCGCETCEPESGSASREILVPKSNNQSIREVTDL